MNLNVRFKNFEGNEALKSYLAERTQKLDKFLPPNTTLNATLEEEKVRKIAEITFHHKGSDYVAKRETENMLTSIDEAIDKLLRQLSRAKDRKIVRNVPDVEV